MSDQVASEATTAADLARLRNEGRPLSSQELKELSTRVKALEEMARLEDRLKALESQKRPRFTTTEDQLDRQLDGQPDRQPDPYKLERSSTSRHHSIIQPSIELDNSNSSSSDTMLHQHKRRHFTKGIRITPSYTLRVSSSLKEWGD